MSIDMDSSASICDPCWTSRPADSGKTMCPAPAHLATRWQTPSAPLASTPCASSTKRVCRWRLPQSMLSSRHVAGLNDDDDGDDDDDDGEDDVRSDLWSSVAFGT